MDLTLRFVDICKTAKCGLIIFVSTIICKIIIILIIENEKLRFFHVRYPL